MNILKCLFFFFLNQTCFLTYSWSTLNTLYLTCWAGSSAATGWICRRRSDCKDLTEQPVVPGLAKASLWLSGEAPIPRETFGNIWEQFWLLEREATITDNYNKPSVLLTYLKGLLKVSVTLLLRETQAWTSGVSRALWGCCLNQSFIGLGVKTLKLLEIGSLRPHSSRKRAELAVEIVRKNGGRLLLSPALREQQGKWAATHLLVFQCTLFLQEFLSIQNNKYLVCFFPPFFLFFSFFFLFFSFTCSVCTSCWGFGKRKGLYKWKSLVVVMFLVS